MLVGIEYAIVSTMETPRYEKIEYSEEGKELKERYSAVIRKDYIAVSEKIAHFIRDTLWNKYDRSDLVNYEAYHIVIGSTPHAKPEYFDLEGEDSIVAFIDSLEREFENSDEKE